jgi:truncated hemoglobin YjbI
VDAIPDGLTLLSRIGGAPAVDHLVKVFYARVNSLPDFGLRVSFAP